MKHILRIFLVIGFLSIILAACSNDSSEQNEKDRLQVVSSFSIITDIIQEIGGDQVEVYNLVPLGTDPHEYEPLPDDIKAATKADVLFYNGFDLEGGDHGWFAKLVESVGQDDENVFSLNHSVKPMYIDDDEAKETNPHSFLSPKVGIQITENARDALIEIDPDHENLYKENAARYLEQLAEIDALYEEKISKLPEQNRILVTSERAFQYVANDYGLQEGYIWAIDTEENGSPKQIKELVQFLENNKVPALFVETNVDHRPMETVSKETNIPIFGEVYSDEIGKEGEADTYTKYLTYNIEQIYNGLTDE